MLARNVLIFHLGALGDFVLTWPLALALTRIHPQSRIIFVTHAQKGALAEKVLRVESADIEAGWHHLYGDVAALPPSSARLLAGAHSIYSFIATPGDAWMQQAQRAAPQAQIVSLQPRPAGEYSGHVSEFLLEQLTSHKAVAEAMRQMLHWLAKNGLARPAAGARTIVIHPGSGSPAKCWPAEHFIQLVRLLSQQRHAVRVILGEVELERWPAGLAEVFATLAEVRRPSTYVELLAALSDAALYIGNDSGPTHLAGVLGLPTIALFGPTNPAMWHPLGPRIQVVRASPLADLTPIQLMESIAQTLHP